jgi:hypothetical protein
MNIRICFKKQTKRMMIRITYLLFGKLGFVRRS